MLAPVAHAMTDVTGFGLAGHLLEMLDASGCAAVLRLDAVPLMPGAAELAAGGQGSSLQPANLAAVGWRMTAPQDARVDLLTDPQTCGGLLAAVPGDRAAALVADLRAAGHEAAVIGEVTAAAPKLTVI
jgi:selenide,water dikinase